MADWLDCELTVVGEKAPLDTFEKNAQGYVQKYLGSDTCWESLCFHSLYPVPNKLLVTYYSEKSYAWERKHWGCKHGAKHSRIEKKSDESVVYTFLVSELPLKWLRHISKDYSELVFHFECQSEIDGSRCKAVVENGIILTQEYI